MLREPAGFGQQAGSLCANDARVSRTVLRETQGEIPWVYSPKVNPRTPIAFLRNMVLITIGCLVWGESDGEIAAASSKLKLLIHTSSGVCGSIGYHGLT